MSSIFFILDISWEGLQFICFAFFPHIQEQYVAMEGVIILHFGVKMFIYLFFA